MDNRGGAGGSIGAEAVARSAPDGQTLLMGTVGTQAINPRSVQEIGLTTPSAISPPIALVVMAPVAIVVHPVAADATTLPSLVALAKRMPGKLNYGSAGAGTPGHLTAEMFKKAAGIEIQHVPYKGSAPAIIDLLGGQIQIMFDPLQSVLVEYAGGQVAGRRRSRARQRSPAAARGADNRRVRISRASRPPRGGACLGRRGMLEATTAALASEIERIVQSDAFREPDGAFGCVPQGHDRRRLRQVSTERTGKVG